MIKVLVGDMFESRSQTLVNTVNCVGVMGKGIALGFKNRFPTMFEEYQRRCKAGEMRLGEPYLFPSLMTPWILNFPTKDHWRSVANIRDIIQGLDYLIANYREWGITSLAVPPLGCGEGQLEWRVVGPTLYRYLDQLAIPVELYAPYGTPATELEDSFLAQPPAILVAGGGQGRVEGAWVAIVDIIARLEEEPYHWPLGRTAFQKIAYFATECDIPTRLTFAKGSYGPFAADLKHRTAQLVNNGLLQEEHLGNMFLVSTGSTFEDARLTYANELREWEPTIQRVKDLFLRMRTRQAEVAATVHFSAKLLTQELQKRPSENDVLAFVFDWKSRRKPPFETMEVASTIRSLAALRWLKVEPSMDLPVPPDDLPDC